jgi:Na+-translocating ferredoxin:NAD+ oxidoreductase RnfC subunit
MQNWSFMSSKTFHGGVHPKEYKHLTEHLAFELFPLPEQIIFPLSQHLGKDEMIVSFGVKKKNLWDSVK